MGAPSAAARGFAGQRLRVGRATSRQLAPRCSQLQVKALQKVGETEFDSEVLQVGMPALTSAQLFPVHTILTTPLGLQASSSKAVLVDFTAHWCGPCRLVEPLLDQLQKEYEEVKMVKIDADACKGIVDKYQVGPGIGRSPSVAAAAVGQSGLTCKLQ